MKLSSLLGMALIIAWGITPARAQTTYLYTTITYPGAVSTYATGVNNDAELIGDYCLTDFYYDYSCHAFSWKQGIFQSIDAPHGLDTSVTAINNAGTITGSYIFHKSRRIGFVLEGGIYYTVSIPGYDTYMTGLSGSGKAIGYALLTGGTDSAVITYDNGKFTLTKMPGRMAYPSGINSSGSVVGDLQCPVTYDCSPQAFETSSHHTSVFSNRKVTASYGTAINDSGTVLGVIDKTSSDFGECVFWSNSVFQSCSVPGVHGSSGVAINQRGDILGSFYQSGSSGVFVRDAAGTFTQLAPASAGSGSPSAGGISDNGYVVGALPITVGYAAFLASPQ